MHASNNNASKFIKQILAELKGETDKFTVVDDYFIPSLEKTNKNITLNNTIKISA